MTDNGQDQCIAEPKRQGRRTLAAEERKDLLRVRVEIHYEADGYQTLSYFDGVCWPLITASSVGYHDITQRTKMGRIIAAPLGMK